MRQMTTEELNRWFRDPHDLAVWEDIASWFHRETGHLRPGKDKPTGFHVNQHGEPDCCADAFLLWSEGKRQEAVRGLLAERTRYREALEWIASPMPEVPVCDANAARKLHAFNTLNP